MSSGPLPRHTSPTAGLVTGLSILAAMVLLAAPGSAAPLASPPPTAPVPHLEPTPESVQEFLDTRVPELLAEHDVPGAAVSVVADGAQVASGAYGRADPADQTPFTEDHLLPIGSVAKSFTAAAVLQLVDEGVLDLHENVNTYLPAAARVPDTFAEPITLHHLLTHTSGFEDRLAGAAVTDPADLVSLEEYVHENQVRRVRAPGRYSLYSNHGLALAGYIVELRSGVPFADRLRESLFEPLAMTDTAFVHLTEVEGRLPVPHHPDGRVAADLYLNQTPAGSAVTTTADMGRFMLALLGGGELDDERVLSPSSASLMLEPQWFLTAESSGVGYGTWEYRQDPPRVVGHMGDLPGHHADYLLVPDANLGLFVGSNSVHGPRSQVTDHLREFRLDLRRLFLREFAPQVSSLPADPNALVELDRYTGTYLNLRLSASDASRIRALGGFVRVERASGGGLTVLSGPGEPLTMHPAGKGVFVSEDGRHRVAFRENSDRAVAMVFEGNAITTYGRVGPLRDPLLHQVVLLVSLLVLATCLVWPITALVHRLKGRGPRAPRRAIWARLTAFAALVGAGVGFGAVGYLGLDPDTSYRWLFEGSLMLALPLSLSVPFLVAPLVWTVMAWVGRWWSVPGRIHYSLIALAGAALLALGVYYRLLWPLG